MEEKKKEPGETTPIAKDIETVEEGTEKEREEMAEVSENMKESEEDKVKETNPKKQFVIYMVSVFGLAYILQIIASILTINGLSIIFFSTILAVSMFMPLAATFICKRGLKGMGFVPKLKGRLRFLFAAWFLPSVFTILGAVLFFALFTKTCDLSGEAYMSTMGEDAVKQLESIGITFPILVLTQAAQAVSFAPFINMIFAAGEEIGWRGYMYPVLKKKFGVNIGRIVGGVIWGVWHWPVIVLAGYEYGTDYYGAPFIGPILFCFVSVVLGTILDYWYEKTECIWIPALGHGGFNAIAAIGLLFLKPEYSRLALIGPAPVGIIASIPMIVYVIYIFIKESKKKNA